MDAAPTRAGHLARWWDSVEHFLIGLLAGVALLLAAYTMATRYFAPAHSPDWGDEVQVFLVIWAVFLAGSTLVARERHVRADLVLRSLPEGMQRALEAFNSAAALFFCAVMTWYGVEMTHQAWLFDDRTVSSLRFPLWIYYACLPAGMALMGLRYLRRLHLCLSNIAALRARALDFASHE